MKNVELKYLVKIFNCPILSSNNMDFRLINFFINISFAINRYPKQTNFLF